MALLATVPLMARVEPEEAARLVAQIQLPAGELVEAHGERSIVNGDLTVREELLVLLGSRYPETATVPEIIRSMDRRAPNSVRNGITALWRAKLVHRDENGGIVLTGPGLREAVEVTSGQLN